MLRAPAPDGAGGPGGAWRTYRRREYSDRIVVAVGADAPWSPVAGRHLDDAELTEIYTDAG